METPKIGDRIKRLRESRNYSQDYVSSKLGISQKAYSKIENNETKLNLDHLYRLSEVLETPVGEIIDPNAKAIYNHFQTVHGEGFVLNKYTSEKIVELYEKLLKSKDEEITLLKTLLEK